MSRAGQTGGKIRIELLCRKSIAGHRLTVEERLEVFDANTKWLDELQSEQLKEAKAKGTRVPRESRGWTRDDLYDDLRGLPR